MDVQTQRPTSQPPQKQQIEATLPGQRTEHPTTVSGVHEEVAVLHGELRLAWERQQARHRSGLRREADTSGLESSDQTLSCMHWEQAVSRRHCQDELQLLTTAAASADLSLLIIDGRGRVLCTQTPGDNSSPFTRLLMESGGVWAVPHHGMSAISRALTTGVTVVAPADQISTFSSSFIGVEYAVPVVRRESHAVLAVIGLSGSNSASDPMTLAFLEAVCLSISKTLARLPVHECLSLNLLGTPAAHCDGCPLKLTRRQLEILALLALHPEGLGTEQLLAALYGDRLTGISTLKAEISRLRKALRGRIASRPYRLTLPVQGDFLECWQLLQHRHYDNALALLRGPFFSATDSPGLIHWRHCFEVSIGRAMDSCTDECLLSSVQAANPDLADL